MPPEGPKHSPSRDLPYSEAMVMIRGQRVPSVRAEGHRGHRRGMPEGTDHLARVGVPQPDALVMASGKHESAVRAESH